MLLFLGTLTCVTVIVIDGVIGVLRVEPIKDFDALDRLGATINERWGKLDILLGNAGVLGIATPLAQLKPSVFEDVFAVNVT